MPVYQRCCSRHASIRNGELTCESGSGRRSPGPAMRPRRMDSGFLIAVRAEQNGSLPMTVVMNWMVGLKK